MPDDFETMVERGARAIVEGDGSRKWDELDEYTRNSYRVGVRRTLTAAGVPELLEEVKRLRARSIDTYVDATPVQPKYETDA